MRKVTVLACFRPFFNVWLQSQKLLNNVYFPITTSWKRFLIFRIGCFCTFFDDFFDQTNFLKEIHFWKVVKVFKEHSRSLAAKFSLLHKDLFFNSGSHSECLSFFPFLRERVLVFNLY